MAASFDMSPPMACASESLPASKATAPADSIPALPIKERRDGRLVAMMGLVAEFKIRDFMMAS
jgi:hypothetical protein